MKQNEQWYNDKFLVYVECNFFLQKISNQHHFISQKDMVIFSFLNW